MALNPADNGCPPYGLNRLQWEVSRRLVKQTPRPSKLAIPNSPLPLRHSAAFLQYKITKMYR